MQLVKQALRVRIDLRASFFNNLRYTLRPIVLLHLALVGTLLGLVSTPLILLGLRDTRSVRLPLVPPKVFGAVDAAHPLAATTLDVFGHFRLLHRLVALP